jgi:hypothetical protein
VFNEYPLAFEYEPFLNNVDKPLLDRHQRTANARSIIGGEGGMITFDEYKDAIAEVDKINRLAVQDRGATEEMLRSGEAYSDMELELLEELQDRINRYRTQKGGTAMPQGEMPLSPQPMTQGNQQEYRPQSREEYIAIPSGAIFIDPQGNRRIKP